MKKLSRIQKIFLSITAVIVVLGLYLVYGYDYTRFSENRLTNYLCEWIPMKKQITLSESHTIKDENGGYTIRYPKGWYIEPAESAGTHTTITNYDPLLLDGRDALPETLHSDFTKIAIGSEDNTQRLPLEKWVREKYTRIEEVVGSGNPIVSVEVIDIGSHLAVEVQIGDGEKLILSRFILVDKRVYSITMEIGANHCSRMLFDSVADSFEPHQ